MNFLFLLTINKLNKQTNKFQHEIYDKVKQVGGAIDFSTQSCMMTEHGGRVIMNDISRCEIK